MRYKSLVSYSTRVVGYSLPEAGARSFDIPIWEKLVFHVKNWENEKYDEFPVVTIPCKLHGFFTGAN